MFLKIDVHTPKWVIYISIIMEMFDMFNGESNGENGVPVPNRITVFVDKGASVYYPLCPIRSHYRLHD